MSRWSGDSLLVPTHFYTVVTSCLEVNRSVEDCGGPLRVLSFLVPHRPDTSEVCNVSAGQQGAPGAARVLQRGDASSRLLPLCVQSAEDESQWVEELLKLHTARVRDVELLTGLDLFRSTNLTYSDTLSLKTRLHTFQRDD